MNCLFSSVSIPISWRTHKPKTESAKLAWTVMLRCSRCFAKNAIALEWRIINQPGRMHNTLSAPCVRLRAEPLISLQNPTYCIRFWVYKYGLLYPMHAPFRYPMHGVLFILSWGISSYHGQVIISHFIMIIVPCRLQSIIHIIYGGFPSRCAIVTGHSSIV